MPGLTRMLSLPALPVYRQHLRYDARFLFKHLTHEFLCRRMSVAERSLCVFHHYVRMQKMLPEVLLRQVLRDQGTALQIRHERGSYTVQLSLSRPDDKEGEFSLSLLEGEELLYVLSFTVVPGRVVGRAEQDVLLVSRLQGVRARLQQIRAATRALHDVAPAALLMAALDGMAQSLKIRAIVGVQGQDQTAYNPLYASSFQSCYDDFFQALGMELNARSYYYAQLPLPEKPMQQIKPRHRLRTREKREFKRRVAEAVANYFGRAQCGRAVDFSVDAASVLEEP
ncbi:DUF535 family protein [Telmatobacter bradus]|uniref:DUF535 family protein n=1 Tax=Telmatobacter bradus TaxID=474953 RepID=UPI003B43865E